MRYTMGYTIGYTATGVPRPRYTMGYSADGRGWALAQAGRGMRGLMREHAAMRKPCICMDTGPGRGVGLLPRPLGAVPDGALHTVTGEEGRGRSVSPLAGGCALKAKPCAVCRSLHNVFTVQYSALLYSLSMTTLQRLTMSTRGLAGQGKAASRVVTRMGVRSRYHTMRPGPHEIV